MTTQGFSETLKGQGPCWVLEELSGLCFPIVWTSRSPFGPTHSVLSLLGIINFPLLTSLCSLTFYSLCSFSCQVFGGTPARFLVRPAEETSEWTVLPHISQEAQLPGLLPQLAGAFPPMAAGWGESVPFLCPRQACDFVLGFCPVSLCLSASKLGPAVFVCGSYFHETCRFF